MSVSKYQNPQALNKDIMLIKNFILQLPVKFDVKKKLCNDIYYRVNIQGISVISDLAKMLRGEVSPSPTAIPAEGLAENAFSGSTKNLGFFGENRLSKPKKSTNEIPSSSGKNSSAGMPASPMIQSSCVFVQSILKAPILKLNLLDDVPSEAPKALGVVAEGSGETSQGSSPQITKEDAAKIEAVKAADTKSLYRRKILKICLYVLFILAAIVAVILAIIFACF